MNWYRKSQEETSNLNGWITPNNKFLNFTRSHIETLRNNNIELSTDQAINQGYIWSLFEDRHNTLAVEFDISRYQYAIDWGRKQAHQHFKIKELDFTTYKNSTVLRSVQESVNQDELV